MSPAPSIQLRCDCMEWTGDIALAKEIAAGFIFNCPKCGQAIREVLTDDPLKRPCRLCGHPLGKHVAPPYGTKREQVGAMGLMCPIDTRIDALTDEQQLTGDRT